LAASINSIREPVSLVAVDMPPWASMLDSPVTLCVLVWANEGRRDDLIAYENTVLAFIPDHGGRVVQRVRTDGSSGEPCEIHLIEFPSEADLDAYLQDDRRAALAEARTAAIARTEVLRVTPI
jgi:uncharacterized protein (DUF1330 family)